MLKQLSIYIIENVEATIYIIGKSCVCIYIYIFMYTCVYIYIYIYIHKYMNIHIIVNRSYASDRPSTPVFPSRLDQHEHGEWQRGTGSHWAAAPWFETT